MKILQFCARTGSRTSNIMVIIVPSISTPFSKIASMYQITIKMSIFTLLSLILLNTYIIF